jgi:uncharacterized membrane protein
MTASTTQREATSVRLRAAVGHAGWYAGAVVVGSVLMVAAAINQPYNQNELQQMAPYGSDSIEKIIHGTRQPPLDPLLGALVQHLLGEGQLRQRVVPVLAGIGTLVLMSLLLRRLGMAGAGAFGVWVLATAPLMVRYSAYTRPYALPLFLMMVFGYAVQRWLDDRQHRGWLVLAAAAAVAMLLTRLPEPTMFLVTTAAVLAWFAHRGRYSWSQTWPLVAISIGAVVLVGYPEFRSLSSSVVFDLSPLGIANRFGSGMHHLATFVLPLLASWLPWWPVTVLVIVTAVLLSRARRQLARWWFFWPALVPPVAFVFAYELTTSFNVLRYRPHFAYFFLPAYVLVVVALARALKDPGAMSRRLRVGIGVLLGAALLSQLPATANAVLNNEAADYGQAADVLTHDIPADAIVLYDNPNPAGLWRAQFLSEPRYMGASPLVIPVRKLARYPRELPAQGPVYVLVLDSQCGSVVCDFPPQHWNRDVPGWRVESRFDRFTLYAQKDGPSGRRGVIRALLDFAKVFGPDLGYPETFAAAAELKLQGNPAAGHALIHHMYAVAPPDVVMRIQMESHHYRLNPFRGDRPN